MAPPHRVRAARPNNSYVSNRGGLKLDRAVITQLCALIEEGLGPDSALNYLGIRTEAFHRWLRKGEMYWRGNASSANPRHALYGEFVMALRKATATFVLTQTRAVTNNKKGWFRALNVLERRDRKNWARREPMGGSLDSYDPQEKFL